jgi:hypothetical protein
MLKIMETELEKNERLYKSEVETLNKLMEQKYDLERLIRHQEENVKFRAELYYLNMNKEPKFKVGDKAHKPKGYKFPCTIVGVFQTINGDIRVVGEMDEYGLLHIFNEEQLEHYA